MKITFAKKDAAKTGALVVTAAEGRKLLETAQDLFRESDRVHPARPGERGPDSPCREYGRTRGLLHALLEP